MELEVLSKERKGLIGGAHGGGGGQSGGKGEEPENEVENGETFLDSCLWMLGGFCGGGRGLGGLISNVDGCCISAALHFLDLKLIFELEEKRREAESDEIQGWEDCGVLLYRI